MTERLARGLLMRLRNWDMLDACADGAYWKREIDAVLSVQPDEFKTRLPDVVKTNESQMLPQRRTDQF